MTKSIIFPVLFCLFSLFSTNLMAQLGNTTLSISGGQFFTNPIRVASSGSIFSSGKTSQTSKFTPHIAFKVERRFGKYFSLGLNIHSISEELERTIDNGSFQFFNGTTFTTVSNITNQRVSSKLGGMALNIKGFIYSNAEADLYVGAGIGILSNRENIETINTNTANAFTDSNNTSGIAELNVGLRYFLANNLGFYAEIGTVKLQLVNGIAGQVGVIYRF
jgi:hypothetical protein